MSAKSIIKKTLVVAVVALLVLVVVLVLLIRYGDWLPLVAPL